MLDGTVPSVGSGSPNNFVKNNQSSNVAKASKILLFFSKESPSNVVMLAKS